MGNTPLRVMQVGYQLAGRGEGGFRCSTVKTFGHMTGIVTPCLTHAAVEISESGKPRFCVCIQSFEATRNARQPQICSTLSS